MSILLLVTLCLGAFALLSTTIRSLELRIATERTTNTIGSAALLAVLGFARGVALVASATALLVWAGVFLVLQVRPGTTPAEMGEAIALVQSWRALLVGFGPVLGALVAFVLIAALGVHAHRSGKRRLERLFQDLFDREFARIHREFAEGRFEQLPPTQEMLNLLRQIGEGRALLEHLENNPRSHLLGAELSGLRQTLELMQQHYVSLDIRRRMNLQLDPDQVELPLPRTWWQRAQTFLISRGLMASLNGASRLLYLACLLLLVPCLLGLYSPVSGKRIEAQVVEFRDLQIDFEQREALASWQQAEQALLEDVENIRRDSLDRQHQQTQQAEKQQDEAEEKQHEEEEQHRRKHLALVHQLQVKYEQQQTQLDPLKPEELEKHKLRRQGELEELLRQQEAERQKRTKQRAETVQRREAERAQQKAALEEKGRATRAAAQLRHAEERGRDSVAKQQERGKSPEQWRQRQTEAERQRAEDAVGKAARQGRDALAAAQEKGKKELARLQEEATRHGRQLEEELKDKVENRRVERNREHIAAELKQAREKAGAFKTELNDADRAVLREVSRHVERATAQAWQEEAPARLSSEEVRALAVRDQILQRAAKYSHDPARGPPAFEVQPSLSRLADVEESRKALLRSAEKAVDPAAELTEVGKRAYAQLEDAARRQPGLLGTLREQLKRFQEPASRCDIRNRLTLTLLGQLLGGVNEEAAVLFRGVEHEAVRTQLDRYVSARLQELVGELYRGGNLDRSLKRMGEGNPDRPVMTAKEEARLKETMRGALHRAPSGDQAAQPLRTHPPTVSDIPERHVDTRGAAQSVAEHSRQSARSLGELFGRAADNAIRPAELAEARSDPLNRYEDFFPGQLGAETRTDRGRLLDQLAGITRIPPRSGENPPEAGGLVPTPNGPRTPPGGGAGARDSVKSFSPAQLHANFNRARSYRALRGFARVGGVLIGQDIKDPPAENRLDLRGFHWEIEGENVSLVFRGADDKETRSRPFRKAVVYHALTYAADGRPLAVTMTKAEPLPELRILLHPTLLDSPLGCRIIELDRFVDQFTSEGFPSRAQSTAFVLDCVRLYRSARALRVLALLDAPRFKTFADKIKVFSPEQLAKLRADAQADLEKSAPISADVFKFKERVGDPLHSPLTAKKDFFDPELVQLVMAGVQGGSLEAYTATLKGTLSVQAGTNARQLENRLEAALRVASLEPTQEAARQKFAAELNEALNARLIKWLLPVPEFEPWSGVREQVATADRALLLEQGQALPMPFEFMVQIAFTSAPMFLKDEGKRETYVDEKPWEFPAMAKALQAHVLRRARQDERARVVLDDSREFAAVQRLFRVAFLGKLGKEFPLEKLIALLDATAPPRQADRPRTPRWNSGAGFHALTREVSYIRRIEDGAAKLEKALGTGLEADEAVKALQSCRELLRERERRLLQQQKDIQGLQNERRTLPALARLALSPHNVIPLPFPADVPLPSSHAGWLQRHDNLWKTYQHDQGAWWQRWHLRLTTGREHWAPLLKQLKPAQPKEADAFGDLERALDPGPWKAEHRKKLAELVMSIDELDHVIRLRRQLAVEVDDRQSLQELLWSPALPPL